MVSDQQARMGNQKSVCHLSSEYLHTELIECLRNKGNLLILPDVYPVIRNIKRKTIVSISDQDIGRVYNKKVKHITFSTSIEGGIKVYGANIFNPELTKEEAINKLKAMYPEQCNRYVVIVLENYIYK